MIIPILLIPLILAGLPAFLKNIKKLHLYGISGYALVLILSAWLAGSLSGFSFGSDPAAAGTVSYFKFFFADSLSGFFLLLISAVGFAVMLYSAGYIGKDVVEKVITHKEARLYFTLINLFMFTMLFTTVVNNLGILWVSVEMTTLTSAFLVGFYNKSGSVEAAWKYIIICSVGITLALFGTILFYYAAKTGAGIQSLYWTDLVSHAAGLNPGLVKTAFLFILIGYGTKAGLAPMHTWLPDAHSQALAPVSALLSGVLLKTALYVIMRYMIIVNKTIGTAFTGNLFTLFGILSLAVAAGFILIQKDLKRLLAYSSIEHVGIILFGLGMGGTLGLYGALFHAVNHAFTKSLMFFGAGSIVRKYGTHNMRSISGVVQSMPFTGVIVLLGSFALAGTPPFSIFISEVMILVGGFEKGAYLSSALFLLFVGIIFGAIVHHFNRMLFGKKPEGMPVNTELPGTKAAMLFLLGFILLFGITVPGFFDRIISSAVDILSGL